MSEPKLCGKCLNLLDEDKFYTKNGIASSPCKKCYNLANKNYREANRESVAKTKAVYSILNKKKLNKTSKAWDKANPERKLANLEKSQLNNPDKKTANSAKMRAKRKQAVPKYIDKNEHQLILDFYTEAKFLEKLTGIKHQVDHIIPLSHPLVCGLHVSANLQILTSKKNLKKSNFFVPFVESDVSRHNKIKKPLFDIYMNKKFNNAMSLETDVYIQDNTEAS